MATGAMTREPSRIQYWQALAARYLRGGSVSFWHTHLVAKADYDPATLRGYYIDFSSKTGYPGPFDERGVPLLDYKGVLGIRYNACAVAQYALGVLEQYYRTGDSAHLDLFLRLADWLVANIRTLDSGLAGWPYDFKDGGYVLAQMPWFSALAQGQAISVLLRAYRLSGRGEYTQAATAAFQVFHSPVEKGGVRSYDAEGHLFFEEAPTTPPSYILDGFMFSLFGVYDYYLVMGDKDALAFFREGVRTLEACLAKYDLGFWSRADLYSDKPKMIASPFYHHLHVEQLRVLYRITSSEPLRYYAERWARFQANPILRTRAWFYKLWFKLFVY
jgi:hypothetical protein